MRLEEYPDRELMMMGLADRLAGDLRMALQQADRVGFAVPGGTTPGPIFDTLSDIHLDWDRVTVMLTDERWVPETSDRSNTALLKSRLLRNAAAAAEFFAFYDGAAQPEDSLEALNEAIKPILPLSVVLLGMGADMHTASLFPGAEGLHEALASDAPPLVAVRGGGAPEARITLSAHVLRQAIESHIVITGDEKREALERARHLPPEEAPVSAILSQAVVHWAP